MKLLTKSFFFLFFTAVLTTALAEDFGTRDEARAMAIKAAALIEEVGIDEAREQLQDKNGSFIMKDLYVFVYDNQANVTAHGAKPHLVGKNLLKIRDVDGKYPVQDMLAIKPGTTAWIDYKWPNSVTKKIDKKSSYIIRFNDYFVGVGTHDLRSTHASSEK